MVLLINLSISICLLMRGKLPKASSYYYNSIEYIVLNILNNMV